MGEITRNPLCWPNHIGRTVPGARHRPQFQERSIAWATDYVLQEINRLNQRRWDHRDEHVIVSTNLRLKLDGLPHGTQPEPSDTGVAVYFRLRFYRAGKSYERPCVLTCDKWCKVAFNLTAIAKDIEAQRARQRWGCTSIEQAFQGYVAIPEKCGGGSWWDVLGVKPTATKEEIVAAQRLKAKSAHPDVAGGSHEKFSRLQEAYEQALGAVGGR
jgi:hypothetical protein